MMNQVKIPISEDVRKEYIDPVQFMDRQDYKKRHRQIKKRALIAGAIGLTILIVAPILYAHGDTQINTGPRSGRGGNPGLFLLALGLTLYGLYQLMTINRRIRNGRRVELLWLYPDLKHQTINEKDNPLPKIIILLIISTLLLIGLYFWISSIVS